MNPTFITNVTDFNRMVAARAKAFKLSRAEAFTTECRLLAKELMDRTPPFSGKSIVKMLASQGKSLTRHNADVQPLNAKKVGERRVEKDIRKVILGIRGAAIPRAAESPVVIVSQTNPRSNQNTKAEDKARKTVERRTNKQRAKYGKNVAKDGGILTRVQGKDAVRVYADKKGNVYGVDTESFNPKASMADLSKVHNMARTKKGRVSNAGKADKITGRWVWLNKLVTKEQTLKKYIKKAQRMVGEAKGGWCAAFMRFGGKTSMSGWVGEHAAKAGRVRSNMTEDQMTAELINRSRWANGGDDERIIPKALEGREKSLKAAIWREMNDAWHKGGTVPK